MTIGGGEAADQMVRMMLSGGEVAVRLGGSALKNLLALTMALARHEKTLSGKVNMDKMLRETRDLRLFPMSPEQFKQFQKHAKRQKILFSAIRDRDGRGRVIDVVMPVTELDRANPIFERILYQGPTRQTPEREGRAPSGPVRGPVGPPRNEAGNCPSGAGRSHRRAVWGRSRLRQGQSLSSPKILRLTPDCRTIRGRSRQKKILGRDETRAIPTPAPLPSEGAAGRVTGRPSWGGFRGIAPGWTVKAEPSRPKRKPR